ncbi:hypothetical protein [Comamonas testosteroni]|uniref:hypothetical protein n=1 Tax=Comamonas testosteroni TaxID=285 RepID=UPI0006B99752|nr:hypothetical protein [Comamonas testosteroni]
MIASMQKSSKPVGRPATHIKPSVLSQLREDAGFTQFELAKAVYELAGKPWVSVGSLKSTAQRWETKGTLDKFLAVHLATVLKTTLPILMGEHPMPAPNRLSELENILRIRALDGENSQLQLKLKQLADQGGDPVAELASDLNRFIEVAQLSQSSQAFEHISELTGLDRSELELPTSYYGFWLVIGSGHGPAFREIVTGVDSIRSTLRKEWEEASKLFGIEDCSIEFSEEKPWFKVRWTSSRLVGFSRTIRFVRCQPTIKGLNWVSPSEWDKCDLKAFAPSARPYFDVIKGLDAVSVPAVLKNLRVRIERNYSPREYEENPSAGYSETLALHAGELPEYADQIIEDCASTASIHFRAIQYLCFDLWEALQPLLSDWPLKYWSIKAGGSYINVVLGEIPFREWILPNVIPPMGNRISLSLVELEADGTCRSAPWKTPLVELICQRLTNRLQDARN